MAVRVLVVLPTRSYRAAAFVDAARGLGLEVVVAAEHPSTLGGRLEDRELVLDLGDAAGAADRAAAVHRRRPLHGVVGVDESAVTAAAAIAARLGLPHHPVEAVAATRDKRLLRQRLDAGGVRQPAWSEVSTGASDAELTAAVAAAGGFPVVVKPVGLAASQGVLRADDAGGLRAAVDRVRTLLDRLECDPGAGPHPLLLERFVDGAELAVEGLVRRGRLDVVALFDKPEPLVGPTFAETLYVAPSRQPPALRAAVMGLVGQAVRALGLSDGPVHAEVRVPPLTGPVLLEVAARSIGGLCSRAVRVCALDPDSGLPQGEPFGLEEAILRHACGLELPERLGPAPGATGVLMLPVEQAGTLMEVSGVDAARGVEGVASVDITVPPGASVEPLPEGDRYLGFVVAAGDHPLRVEEALRRAWAQLAVEIG